MAHDIHRRTVSVLAAGAFALLASDLSAQGIATSVDPTVVQTEIAAHPDFDVAALWRTLKIPAELDTVYAKIGGPPLNVGKTLFDRCSNVCLADIARVDLDDDPGQEVLLTIYQEWKLCRFLVFKSNTTPAGGAQWRFVGYADHDDLGQYDPEYRVALVGGRRYFVVSVSVMHGTGMWLHYDRWYEIGLTGLHEVLSLPSDGLECRDARALCRAFGSTVVASRITTRGEELVVSFAVRYWGDEFLLEETRSGDIPLFGRTQRGVYVRPVKSSERYAFSPLDSDIAAWEIDAAFRPEAFSCQDFLAANSDNLVQLASIRDTTARAWLARYVGSCEPSPQQTRLLDLLTK